MRLFRFVVVVVAAAACARPATVPMPELSPEEEPAAKSVSRADDQWRSSADRDRAVYPALLQRSPDSLPGRSLMSRVISPVTGLFKGAPRPDSAARSARPVVESKPLAAVARSPERFAEIATATVNTPPSPDVLPAREGPAVVRAQVLLDRARFSVGVIDGRAGRNTEKALYWFQATQQLPTTGALDAATAARLDSLGGTAPAVAEIELDAPTLAGPFRAVPRSVYAQAELDCLCYGSVLEMLAERHHTTPEVLRLLNPDVDFWTLHAGTRLSVPNVAAATPLENVRVSRIHVSKSGSYVHALAANGSLVYHFPSTLGSRYDPSPDGEFHVTAVSRNPRYRYDPSLFADVPDWKPTAMLPPGPNSPVGVVWIALSKPHVGIHGTPNPELIGVTNSHGCVRLTNWDALRLAEITGRGTPVEFAN